jgi:hypothetical protein
MATLDIRTIGDEPITEIKFGEGDNENSSAVSKRFGHQEVILIDRDDDSSGYIAIKDIDNLILALQKAKELWGK